MERNAHYFMVGLFVSATLLLIVGFVLWLAGTHGSRDYHYYTVYFTDPVSGLNEGASVQYKGVQVGKVLNIRVAKDRHDLIKVDIEVHDSTPVHISTTASLATLGVTGLVFIQLSTYANDNDAPLRLQGERYPVIKGSGSQLSKLLDDVPLINRQILEIATKVNGMLTPENMTKISTTLQNVEQFSASLGQLLNSDNIDNASTALQNIADASDSFGPVLERMEHTAAQLDQTVVKLNALIGQNAASIHKFTGQGLSQITATTREAQSMARSIRELSDRIKQNPSQIIYKPSYQGVETAK